MANTASKIPVTIPSGGAAVAHRAVAGSSPDVLADIYRDDVHMAVWQRQTAPSLAAECQSLLAENTLVSQRATMAATNRRKLATTLPDLANYPHLAADIQLLAEMFSCLFGLKAIGLRLTSLTEAMCPKFHVDRVPCRLITSYSGAGTEWLPHHSVDRRKLGTGSGGLGDAESGLYPSDEHIRRLSPGDVALLKGESWEGNEGAGLVHRSPAVGPGQRRLLLTVDFV